MASMTLMGCGKPPNASPPPPPPANAIITNTGVYFITNTGIYFVHS